MPAPIHEVIAEQGEKYTLDLIYENADAVAVDLTQFIKGRMQVRSSTESTSTSKIIEIDANNVWVEGVTGTGGIVLTHGAVAGKVHREISAATMSTVPSGKFFYDIELVGSTTIIKLLKGRFVVEPEVTR